MMFLITDINYLTLYKRADTHCFALIYDISHQKVPVGIHKGGTAAAIPTSSFQLLLIK